MSSRFVLLRHECPAEFEKPSHWDFMLERDGVLMTWELRQLPRCWSAALHVESPVSPTVPATRLADHRLDYLDYEGPLSDDRGSVRRVDYGTYNLMGEYQGRLCVDLQGLLLKGPMTLSSPDGTWQIGLSE